MSGLTAALREHPLALLELASTYISVLDERGRHPLDPEEDEEAPSLADLVEHLLEDATPPTDALLLAFAAMIDDDIMRMRIRLLVNARGLDVPDWLRQLDEIEVYRTVETVEPLGDGENIIVGVRMPGGAQFTLLVYVDHNMGTLVKDAFALPESFETVIAAWDQVDSGVDTQVRVLSGADAQARITGPIEHGARVYPPIETETWPASAHSSNGSCARFLLAARATSGAHGKLTSSMSSRTRSLPRSTAAAVTMSTIATCSTR